MLRIIEVGGWKGQLVFLRNFSKEFPWECGGGGFREVRGRWCVFDGGKGEKRCKGEAREEGVLGGLCGVDGVAEIGKG